MKLKDFIEFLKTQDPEAIVEVGVERIGSFTSSFEWEEFDPDVHFTLYDFKGAHKDSRLHGKVIIELGYK